jgi:hypothetical protein
VLACGDRSAGAPGLERQVVDYSIRYAGVSCGAHPVYLYMCVITVARTKDGRPLPG